MGSTFNSPVSSTLLLMTNPRVSFAVWFLYCQQIPYFVYSSPLWSFVFFVINMFIVIIIIVIVIVHIVTVIVVIISFVSSVISQCITNNEHIPLQKTWHCRPRLNVMQWEHCYEQ